VLYESRRGAGVTPWSSRMVATPCSRVTLVKVASRSLGSFLTFDSSIKPLQSQTYVRTHSPSPLDIPRCLWGLRPCWLCSHCSTRSFRPCLEVFYLSCPSRIPRSPDMRPKTLSILPHTHTFRCRRPGQAPVYLALQPTVIGPVNTVRIIFH